MENVYKKDGTLVNLLQDTDMEYGSNEHGNYIKYSNGLMVQYGTVYKNIEISNPTAMLYYDDGYVVELPQEFVGGYSANIISSQREKILWVYSMSDFTSNMFKFNLLSNAFQEGSRIPFDWFAIGRWK